MMTRYLLRLFLIAGVFYFILPLIPGIRFHGSFLYALGAGVLFAFLGWLVEAIAIAITAVLTVSTLGLALVVLIPAWLLGFWLLPAVVLKLVADFMPAELAIAGWLPAIWGGLVMLVVGVLTSGHLRGTTRQEAAT
jgi:uncharacterized membrane protein YvlD (DUF360 family)